MPGPPPACRDAPARHARHDGDRHHGYQPDYRKKRPQSLLGELFDF